MEVICKQYYPGEFIDIKYQSFLTGRTYKLVDRIYHQNQFYYRIENETGKSDFFSHEEFKDYFYSFSRMRKDKLLKIIKNNKSD